MVQMRELLRIAEGMVGVSVGVLAVGWKDGKTWMGVGGSVTVNWWFCPNCQFVSF